MKRKTIYKILALFLFMILPGLALAQWRQTSVAISENTNGAVTQTQDLDDNESNTVSSNTAMGEPLAHGTPVERTKPSGLAAEVGKEEKPSRPPERLYGTWTAKDVDAKMGQVDIRLTLRREKKVSLLAWSDIPFVGQVRDLKGSFSVYGDTLSSEAIRDGKKAKFSFESDQLVLRFKSGKVVRFDRE